jgi:transcriptional regulator with XRE-family HTH domain
MDVGKEIRRLREARGWSQAKLAGASDMGTSGISQIETGARNPSAATLSKIAEALGVEVRDLFPLGQAPLPDLEDERPSVAVDGMVGLLERWHGRRLAEAHDPESPHFRDANSAALWVSGAREEANEFCLFLSDWGQEHPEAFGSVWDALRLFGAGLFLDNPAEAGERRLREMADTPNELAARRMECATAEAQVNTERLQELRAAASG